MRQRLPAGRFFSRVFSAISVSSNFTLEGCGEFVRVETERAGLALVNYFALVTDEIHAVRPGRVILFRRIAEFVEYGRKLDCQFSHAYTGQRSPLCLILWAGEDYVVLNVAGHLPDIAGMG